MDEVEFTSIRKLEFDDNKYHPVAWMPESHDIIAFPIHKSIKIVNLTDDRIIQSLQETTTKELMDSEIIILQWSPNSKYIAAGFNNGILIIWDLEKNEEIFNENYNGLPIKSVTWSPSGTMIAFIIDSSIKVLDISSTPSIIHELEPIAQRFIGANHLIAWNPDGKYIAFTCTEKDEGEVLELLKFENEVTAPFIRKIKNYGETEITSIAWNIDGKMIASGLDIGIIDIVDVETSTSLQIFREHTDRISSITWIAWDGRIGNLLASGSHDGRIKIWNIQVPESLQTIIFGPPVYSVVFNNAYKIAGCVPGEIQIWEETKFQRQILARKQMQPLVDKFLYQPGEPGGPRFRQAKQSFELKQKNEETGGKKSKRKRKINKKTIKKRKNSSKKQKKTEKNKNLSN